jgi:predicted acetyltransferase
MDLDVSGLGAGDFDAFFAVECAAFSEVPTPEDRAQAEATAEWDRTFGAYSGPTLCGTTSAYGFELTLPGQVLTPTSGVTAVAVLPTHRRRGVLTALMRHQLADVAARGEVLAVLTASEATIYGRFGYGVATEHRKVQIDRARSRFIDPIDATVGLRLVTNVEAIELGPVWFDQFRRARVGEVSRPSSWWPMIFGEAKTWKGGGRPFVVVAEPTDGRPGGYASYRVDHERPGGEGVLEVREVVAADPEVGAALWRYLLDVDLVTTVEADVATDDELPWRLVDGRAYRPVGTLDFLWARIVDPAGALSARRYPVTDSLVLAVDDAFVPANSGRFRIQGGPDGAEVSRLEPGAGGDVDLALGISELSSIYLGGFVVSRLARAGRVWAASAEVLGRADRFFASDGAGPCCSTSF